MDTNERTGNELPDLTALDDAILAVLSPRLRRLIEEGPSEESGASYVKCGRCRDTGWVETPEGNVRCPHAAKEDRRIRLEHHIRESGCGELGRTQTFETFEAAECADPNTARAAKFLMKLAKNPNHAQDEGLSKKKGLLIAGHTGSGKSHLLRATTVAARENGVLAVFTEFYRLIRRVKESYNLSPFSAPGEKPPSTASEILDNLAQAELLCLDDLGAEQQTDHNLQVVYELLDTLTSRGRTVVISTNLSSEGLRKNYGERIFSRTLELARIVELRAEKDHRAL